MMDKSLALLVAVVCLVLLARLFMPERYRWQLDARARSVWRSLQAWVRRVWGWRSSRKEAARMAEEVIHRARHNVERDGNVLRPKSFKQRRDPGEPRKPH